MTIDLVRKEAKEKTTGEVTDSVVSTQQGSGLALVITGDGSLGGSSSGEIYIANFDTVDFNDSDVINFVAQTTTTASYFTALEDGLYSIHWMSRASGAADRGISKNAKGASDPNGSGSDLTSSSFDKLVAVAGAENTLAQLGGESQASNEGDVITVVVKLSAGDRIRFHAMSALGSGNNNWCRVEQLFKF